VAVAAAEPAPYSPQARCIVLTARQRLTGHSQFKRHRLGVFLSILLGYACYYLTRNSLTFTAPVMVATPELA
jgi:sugar phosphate permease